LANTHTGTPERPLSTQGLLCYRKHWKSKIFDYLLTKTNDEQIAISGLYRFFVLEYGSVSNDASRRETGIRYLTGVGLTRSNDTKEEKPLLQYSKKL